MDTVYEKFGAPYDRAAVAFIQFGLALDAVAPPSRRMPEAERVRRRQRANALRERIQQGGGKSLTDAPKPV